MTDTLMTAPETFPGDTDVAMNTLLPISPESGNGQNGQNGQDGQGIALRIANIIAQRKPYRERVQRLQIQLDMLDTAHCVICATGFPTCKTRKPTPAFLPCRSTV